MIGKALRSIRYPTIVPDCFQADDTKRGNGSPLSDGIKIKSEKTTYAFERIVITLRAMFVKTRKRRKKKEKERRHFLGF